MAIESGFFNSIETTASDGSKTYDREYYAIDFANYLNKVVSNGVFATPSNNLQILASTGMNVVVKNGEGRINGYWVRNTSDYTITIDPADVILNRIDRIVMQLNHENRQIDIVYKVGTLATNPVAPELVRTEQIEEYSLARIYVSKNATTIYQSNITDTRPLENECGLIATMGKMESNNYFIQMQNYVDNFMDEKSTEFKDWFEDVKDEVTATSLYREYQALYKSNVTGQSIITIPTSINYVHNGLDILNVYINGMRLVKDVEYTINADGTSITLANPLDVATQDVEFVNKKSIEDSVAENVVIQVETLQDDVNNLSRCTYVASGSEDNIKLSNIVKNFLDGTGDYSSVSKNASMKIAVSGTLKIDNLIDSQSLFDFSSSTTSNRIVTIDFGNATIPKPTSPSTTQSILAVFNMSSNVIVENANVLVDTYNATTIYGAHGGTIRNTKMDITSGATTIYGIWGAEEVSNSKIDINSTKTSATSYGVYQTTKTVLNTINVTGSGTKYSISAGANQLLLANKVNTTISKATGTVEIGTIQV